MPRASSKLDCLKLGWQITEEYVYDGFFGLIVEGKQRIGKSSYVSQAVAESFGRWEQEPKIRCIEPNYEEVKKWMVFPPKDFLDLVLTVGVGRKERVAFWDDAGFWLFALDWYDPFVKTISKYIQLAGRQFGSLILTTPSQKLISGKVLEALPSVLLGRVVKIGGDERLYRPRKCTIYKRWSYPDGKKGGVKKVWIDNFNAILPDEFFNWYKPKSDHYMDVGLQILKREIRKVTKRMRDQEKIEKAIESLDRGETMEKVHKVAGDPSLMKEVNEILGNLETAKVPA